MAIYNMGQMPKEEDPLAQFSQTVNKLGEMGMQGMIDVEKVKAARQAQALADSAKTAIEKKEKDLQFFRSTWQNLSDKPKNERELFLQTDQGKEYLKTVKGYMPEVFDDNNEPILFPSSKDPQTYTKQFDDEIAAVKSKLLKDGPDSLNEGQLAILKMEGYKDELGETMAVLMKNPDYTYLIQSDNADDQKVAQQMVANLLQQTLKAKGKMKELGTQNKYNEALKLGDQSSGLAGAASNFTNPFNPVNTENPNTALLAPRNTTMSGTKSGGRYKVRRIN